MFTPGLRACAYKTASGRGKWPNRDPLDEFRIKLLKAHVLALLAGTPTEMNLYAFIGNNPLNTSDWLGLCTPGCNRTGCTVRVLPAGYSPETEGELDELGELYEETEIVDTILASGETAAAGLNSLADEIATGVGQSCNTASTSPGKALAETAKGILNKLGPHNGWTPWIFVSYQTCKPRCAIGRFFTGEDGYWKDLAGSKDWEEVPGPLADGGFDGPAEALSAGLAQCRKQQADFVSSHKMCGCGE